MLGDAKAGGDGAMKRTKESTDDGGSLQPGDWVEIDGFLRVGRLVKLDAGRGTAEVEVAGIVWSARLNRLRRTAHAREVGERQSRENRPPAISIPAIAGGDELDLHGMRVEEGMEALDKFVDTAVVNRLETIKIIHGHGSGRLRKAVRDYLLAHPCVRDFQFGAPWEGGLAVTVVRLGRKPR